MKIKNVLSLIIVIVMSLSFFSSVVYSEDVVINSNIITKNNNDTEEKISFVNTIKSFFTSAILILALILFLPILVFAGIFIYTYRYFNLRIKCTFIDSNGINTENRNIKPINSEIIYNNCIYSLPQEYRRLHKGSIFTMPHFFFIIGKTLPIDITDMVDKDTQKKQGELFKTFQSNKFMITLMNLLGSDGDNFKLINVILLVVLIVVVGAIAGKTFGLF